MRPRRAGHVHMFVCGWNMVVVASVFETWCAKVRIVREKVLGS